MAVIRCVKRSAAYRTLRHRFAGSQPPQPDEFWIEDDLAYVVFELAPTHAESPLAPLALFVVQLQQAQLLCARLITPKPGITAVDIVDIYPT